MEEPFVTIEDKIKVVVYDGCEISYSHDEEGTGDKIYSLKYKDSYLNTDGKWYLDFEYIAKAEEYLDDHKKDLEPDDPEQHLVINEEYEPDGNDLNDAVSHAITVPSKLVGQTLTYEQVQGYQSHIIFLDSIYRLPISKSRRSLDNGST